MIQAGTEKVIEMCTGMAYVICGSVRWDEAAKHGVFPKPGTSVGFAVVLRFGTPSKPQECTWFDGPDGPFAGVAGTQNGLRVVDKLCDPTLLAELLSFCCPASSDQGRRTRQSKRPVFEPRHMDNDGLLECWFQTKHFEEAADDPTNPHWKRMGRLSLSAAQRVEDHSVLLDLEKRVRTAFSDEIKDKPLFNIQLVPSPSHKYGYRNTGLTDIYLHF